MTILAVLLAAAGGSIPGAPDPPVPEPTSPRVLVTPDAGLEQELERLTDRAPVDFGLEWRPVVSWDTCLETEGELTKRLDSY